MPRPPTYPLVPETPLTQMRWCIDGLGTFRVVPGTRPLLKQVDLEWLDLPHADDDQSAGWRFHEFGEKPERKERFVVMNQDDRPIAAWLDHDELLQLKKGSAYRLDYFKVRPDARGHGLGRFVFGLIGLRALELDATRIVFQPLPKSEAFYRKKIGATECDDWQGGEQLLDFQVYTAALKKRFEGILHGYRIA